MARRMPSVVAHGEHEIRRADSAELRLADAQRAFERQGGERVQWIGAFRRRLRAFPQIAIDRETVSSEIEANGARGEVRHFHLAGERRIVQAQSDIVQAQRLRAERVVGRELRMGEHVGCGCDAIREPHPPQQLARRKRFDLEPSRDASGRRRSPRARRPEMRGRTPRRGFRRWSASAPQPAR